MAALEHRPAAAGVRQVVLHFNADVAVVELQQIVKNWLNDVNGWNRIDAVIAPLTLRVTSRTSAEVRRNVWCKT